MKCEVDLDLLSPEKISNIVALLGCDEKAYHRVCTRCDQHFTNPEGFYILDSDWQDLEDSHVAFEWIPEGDLRREARYVKAIRTEQDNAKKLRIEVRSARIEAKNAKAELAKLQASMQQEHSLDVAPAAGNKADVEHLATVGSVFVSLQKEKLEAEKIAKQAQENLIMAKIEADVLTTKVQAELEIERRLKTEAAIAKSIAEETAAQLRSDLELERSSRTKAEDATKKLQSDLELLQIAKLESEEIVKELESHLESFQRAKAEAEQIITPAKLMCRSLAKALLGLEELPHRQRMPLWLSGA